MCVPFSGMTDERIRMARGDRFEKMEAGRKECGERETDSTSEHLHLNVTTIIFVFAGLQVCTLKKKTPTPVDFKSPFLREMEY